MQVLYMAKLLVLQVRGGGNILLLVPVLVRKKDTCSAVKQYTVKAAVKRRGTYDQVQVYYYLLVK